MAKKFFYVCAGVLALALAIQLGARVASGQAGGLLVTGGVAGTRGELHASGVDASGNIWVGNIFGGGTAGPIAPPKPGRIVAVEADDVSISGGQPSEIAILYEDGDVYLWYGGPPWQFMTNILTNSPVTATQKSWGQVKDRYRK